MRFSGRESGVARPAPVRGSRAPFGSRCSSFVRRPARAFTLLEIMLAMAIFSLVMAAIYSSWMLILRATRTGEAAAAQAQRRRVAVRTIESALTCVQSYQASQQYYTFIVQNGDEPLLSFTARLPDDFPRNGRFGDFNMRRVTFTVEPGPAMEKDLVLRQNPILMDMDKDEQEHPLVLARNVKSFATECWDPIQKDWSDKWDNTNQIPTMVRFTLALGGNTLNNFGDTSPILSVTRVVAIPSVMVPSVVQSQSAAGGFHGIGPR
ncbi:MAG TPA: prepilin-type N-terminal cleavage/methylation domain-containing protein [Candidatus Acidoferrales bacterium]|nr:prepilin-type N-terminal cleavage/methylation domain-containing protein [Candidatus Acidoferrales bacterium]